ncbi:sulfurtransferase complex subunit TusC [Enterobacteriaceae endosymbiont of Donacia tomentosa]|uniref:sulfurtransferase complex subunit TusC n=1 Tax=Enterobacteriaceae endosymbiont of Donacia tomentosa TaxID=2675787 RepID=UPI001448E7C7|nr:sulfurtransferase complex subunit TusC [Enterobacteriaceae endosymbiont of Donacia tomentosa]QJC31760.1 sulfurtransferase complex subunit TusC [Enterobacteriaceae endosymbiont of Donacia tomentosa]
MNKIAFMFSRSPYGSSIGTEGLDTVISISSFTEDIALFFMGEGILQIKKQQQPEKILLKNYSISFKILNLCNIRNFFVCSKSLDILGIKNYQKDDWVIPVKIMNYDSWKNKLNYYNIILNF